MSTNFRYAQIRIYSWLGYSAPLSVGSSKELFFKRSNPKMPYTFSRRNFKRTDAGRTRIIKKRCLEFLKIRILCHPLWCSTKRRWSPRKNYPWLQLCTKKWHFNQRRTPKKFCSIHLFRRTGTRISINKLVLGYRSKKRLPPITCAPLGLGYSSIFFRPTRTLYWRVYAFR